ncbi:hypothetical protein PABG_02390 [Paracoccidioides brasiliensis Pb03]|nr:hypothetical protein PABG_02390 [Paracoccidioides brasiliensis Pb03]
MTSERIEKLWGGEVGYAGSSSTCGGWIPLLRAKQGKGFEDMTAGLCVDLPVLLTGGLRNVTDPGPRGAGNEIFGKRSKECSEEVAENPMDSGRESLGM